MNTETTNVQTPEERELAKKRFELEALKATLAERELELATLHAELHSFEQHYLRTVGRRYADLDEIEAQIAEAIAKQSPKDESAQEKAVHARSHAHVSSQAVGLALVPEGSSEFKVSDNLKKLYREIAKRIHPDLANDEEDRKRRHEIMAEANHAYAEGDEARLRVILHEWNMSPDAVSGDGTGADLVRVIRKIALIEARLQSIGEEIARLSGNDLYRLRLRAGIAKIEGRDLLSEMSASLDGRIVNAHARLASIQERSHL